MSGCMVALPRLAAGNSTLVTKNRTMTANSQIIQDSFKALVTGYGVLGGWNYAHFPAKSVPGLSLRGDKPFTLFTTLCFKNVQGGDMLEQKNFFLFGIMDGLIYATAQDWCGIKFSEYTLGRLTTNRWYKLGLVYDGSALTVYLDGVRKDTFRCKPASKRTSKEELIIGDKLDAYFKNFRIFDRALSDEQISQLSSGEEITPEDSIAWFDFDRTSRQDNSPQKVKLATKAFARIVLVHPVKQFCFRIKQGQGEVEKTVNKLLEESETISITGCIGKEHDKDAHSCLTGMVSLGTSQPLMCELEGEIKTIWESMDIVQEDI